MQELKEDMQELKAGIGEIKKCLIPTSGTPAAGNQEVQELKEDMQELKEGMQELKADMQEIKNCLISTSSTPAAEMKRKGKVVKADIREIKKCSISTSSTPAFEMKRKSKVVKVPQGARAPLDHDNKSGGRNGAKGLKKGIEPKIRRSEGMERGTEGGSRQSVNSRTSLDHRFKKSEQVEFQLQFANKLPDTIYTKDKIRDESDGSIQIKLVDPISGQIVKVGAISSIEIEIVVLDGDFGFEENENWTKREFNTKIVDQREGKGPLVKGKRKMKLRGGVGIIKDLSFSDNSSWIKCKKFRLGARVVQSSSNIGQVRIKEAISEGFSVKDFRARTYVKHNLPSLDDEVWHLKKVKRGGKFHTRLIDNNIRTVRDFKQMYRTNPNKLREILKDCSDSDWEVIERDASCVVDDVEKLNAHSNSVISRTTGQLPHEFPVSHQGIKKHDLLSLDNQVWHSDNIKECGKFRAQLIENNIHTESDLKQIYKTNPDKLREILKGCSKWEWDAIVQHASPVVDDANSNPLRSQEAEAYNSTATIGPVLPQVLPVNEGSAGMQNDNNHALSSDKIGFSTSEEIVPSLAQPLAMSTCNPVNAPAAPSNVIFNNHQTNNDSGSGSHSPFWNSLQLNNHFLTESYQPYNSPATEPLHLIPHQGMQNDCNHTSSSHHKSGLSQEIVQNLASQSLVMSTYSHVNVQGEHSNDVLQSLNEFDSDSICNLSPFNEFLLIPSSDTQLMTESSQINNGLVSSSHFSASHNDQNSVMSPGSPAFLHLHDIWHLHPSPTFNS